MEHNLIFDDITVEITIENDHYKTQCEKIIADFKTYLPDFNHESTLDALFMHNKEKKRRLMYFKNMFKVDLNCNENKNEQIEFITHTLNTIDSYRENNDYETELRFTFLVPVSENKLPNLFAYPKSEASLKDIALGFIGFVLNYNSDEYTVTVQEGKYVLEDDSFQQCNAYAVNLYCNKKIQGKIDWTSYISNFLLDLPETIKVFLNKTII